MSVNFNINFISVFQNVNLLWEVYITRDISNLHSTFKALASNSRHLSRTGSFVDGAVMSTGVDGSFSSCFSSVFSSEFIDSCDSAISESCEISGEFDVDFLVSPFLLFDCELSITKSNNHKK
jgi:hypothetical protein